MAHVGNLIVVGTYEEFVLGYAIVPEEYDEKKLSLVQTFACHSHRASVRSLAVGGVHLASGSTDETIRLYNTLNQVESGMLTHHNGSVNALAFTEDGTHLITAGDDGMIAVVQTGSWFVEKQWAGTHSGAAVTGLSIHPSGKIALSVGADNRIVTWNLVKGRKAYVANVSSRCRNGWGVGDVQWSPSGSCYAVFMATHAEVYSVATAGVTHTITCSSRVTSMTFLEDDILLVGEESGEASIHKLMPSTSAGQEGDLKEIARFQAHEKRVKSARNFGPVVDGARSATQFVTAGGSGRICLWELEDSEVSKLCEVGTGCRITSMAVVDLDKELKLKKEDDAAQKALLSDTKKKIKNENEAKKRKHADVQEVSGSSNGNKASLKVTKANGRDSSQKKRNGMKFSCELQEAKPTKSPRKKAKKVKGVNAGQWVVTPLE
ncbi:p21-activated protein kinase-interacting protein 1-like [Thrips palmi]|uniref:P21-activated protein kinase-interacting protein 1-like n=1 Tax=Thrips palmi TaxID=161013 RepID=A0A6P8ZWW3_THRPL|nr:p21-activated protein kinase-interacting protein 1-like [Thrips palmi]